MLRRLPLCLLLCAFALPAVPATAAPSKPSLAPSDTAFSAKQRRDASRALDKAEALRAGRGDSHELTPALKDLAIRLRALQGSERKRALELLARPTQGQSNVGEEEYRVPEEPPYDTAHFRFHWVREPTCSSERAAPDFSIDCDEPPLADGDADGVPDYVETMANEFENVHNVEHGQLGWRTPPPDEGRGGSDLTDVYIKQLGDQRIFGYAAPDPLQRTNSQYSFLVLDNDYVSAEYTRYSEPLPPLQVTAAHEYNHVIQFGYDVLQDAWMFESTAVWMEDRVYDDVNDYVNYLTPWSQLSTIPITQFNSNDPSDPGNTKSYGSVVWNRWLDERFGPDVIRQAWEASLQTNPASFAPGAYDVAIRRAGGGSFVEAFVKFVAETAEWRTARFGEGEAWPDMLRLTDEKGVTFAMRPNGPGVEGRLDHTAWAYVSVAAAEGPIKLILTLPDDGTGNRGPSAAGALVGRRGPMTGGTVDTIIRRTARGGRVIVQLDNAEEYERVTAVLVNADIGVLRFSAIANDWIWTHDNQRVTAHVSTDFSPPRVRSRSPDVNDRDVSRRSKVTVTFSEQLVGIDERSFRLIAPGGRRVRADVDYSKRRRRATLKPAGRLRAGGRYRAELTRSVVDLGANVLPPSLRRWAFTTAR